MTWSPEHPETVFTYGAPQLKFGPGAADEIGHDLGALGATRVLVVTDVGVLATGWPDRVAEGIRASGLEAVVHDSAHVEPTDASLATAIERARADGPFDGFVAVGGGSSIDTAKAVDLLLTNGGDLMDYVNVPVGAGRAPRRPLAPLAACARSSCRAGRSSSRGRGRGCPSPRWP